MPAGPTSWPMMPPCWDGGTVKETEKDDDDKVEDVCENWRGRSAVGRVGQVLHGSQVWLSARTTKRRQGWYIDQKKDQEIANSAANRSIEHILLSLLVQPFHSSLKDASDAQNQV